MHHTIFTDRIMIIIFQENVYLFSYENIGITPFNSTAINVNFTLNTKPSCLTNFIENPKLSSFIKISKFIYTTKRISFSIENLTTNHVNITAGTILGIFNN